MTVAHVIRLRNTLHRLQALELTSPSESNRRYTDAAARALLRAHRQLFPVFDVLPVARPVPRTATIQGIPAPAAAM